MFKPVISLLATLLLAVPAAAQDAAQPFVVGVQADQSIVVVSGAETTVIHTGAYDYSQITTSPDGRWVAWRALDSVQSGSSLRVYDRATGNLSTVDVDISTGLPITFTSDSQNLVYAFVDPVKQGDGPETLVSVVIQPVLSDRPTITTQVPVQFGCGGGSPIPSEWRYWAETNSFGGNAPILAVTADGGILYSTRCDGVGIAIYNPGTNATMEFPDMARAQYSAATNDVLAIAVDNGVLSTRLVLLDLDSMSLREFDIGAQADQLTFTEDGLGAWASVRAFDGYIPLTDAQIAGLAAGMGIDPAAPPNLPQFVSSLFYVDLATGEMRVTGVDLAAYSIARIQPVGDTVYFAAVDNMYGWLQAIGDGTLDLTKASFQEQEATVGVSTYAYSPADNTVERRFTDMTQPTVIALP